MDHLVEIQILTSEKLESSLPAFIKVLEEFPNEYWQSEHFLTDLPGKWQLSIFAEQHNQLLGYIIASQKGDTAHIHKFMVTSQFRAAGVGSSLMDYFIQNCERLGLFKFSLWVYANNVGAIKFYERHGFAKTTERFHQGDQLFFMYRNMEIE
ncbi:GNAT family N-acetyltransferase [candidate division KSB1 bacterium]|nr:GNAT family N-acetyltransferase [candidate division KSB1 bacterium]